MKPNNLDAQLAAVEQLGEVLARPRALVAADLARQSALAGRIARASSVDIAGDWLRVEEVLADAALRLSEGE